MIKKLFTLVLVAVTTLTVVGCKNPSPWADLDLDTYYSYTSGSSSMNPHNDVLNTASDLFSYVSAGLYTGDYDWPLAIANGLAEKERDFTNSAALPFNRYPSQALYRPIPGELYNSDGTFDLAKTNNDPNNEAESAALASELVGTEWVIVLREDLQFQDGVKINADTLIYSWKMLLDPLLNNGRATTLYDSLNVAGAEAYFKQGKPVDPQNTEGEKWPSNVSFDTVGITKLSEYVVKMTLATEDSQWGLMTSLYDGITGFVHPAVYEAALIEGGTRSRYGTIDFQLPSYGPFILETWQEETVYVYVKNDKFRSTYESLDDYPVDKIRLSVIVDSVKAVQEYEAGRLDVAGVSGEDYKKFFGSEYLKNSPGASMFYLHMNATRPEGETSSPLMTYDEFRQAVYFAVDRQDFVTTVSPPSLANEGFLSPLFQSYEGTDGNYYDSPERDAMLESLGIDKETAGYNPTKAKELFDTAYNKAVADGKLASGAVAQFEVTYYKVDTNDRLINWMEEKLETVFGTDKFDLVANGLDEAGLNAAWADYNYDATLGGWQNMVFWPSSLLAQAFSDQLGVGYSFDFATHDNPITVKIPYTRAHLVDRAEQGTITTTGQEFLDRIAADGTFETTFFELGYYFLHETADLAPDYEGKQAEYDLMTAAVEKILLEVLPSVPLTAGNSATVYSPRVIFQATAFNIYMGWGGMKYMTIVKPE